MRLVRARAGSGGEALLGIDAWSARGGEDLVLTGRARGIMLEHEHAFVA